MNVSLEHDSLLLTLSGEEFGQLDHYVSERKVAEMDAEGSSVDFC